MYLALKKLNYLVHFLSFLFVVSALVNLRYDKFHKKHLQEPNSKWRFEKKSCIIIKHLLLSYYIFREENQASFLLLSVHVS